MRLDKAFRSAPPEIHYAIESAFVRGEAKMKKRHKITLALSLAACMAAMVAVALAVGGTTQPPPDTVAAPGETIELMTPDPPTLAPAATSATPEPTAAPTTAPPESEPTTAPPESRLATSEPTPEPQEDSALPVYYTPQGQYYHGNEDCSGMHTASAHTLAEAKAAGKRRCPVCQPLGEPEHIDLFREALGLEIADVWPGYAYHHLGKSFGGDDAWALARIEDGFSSYIAPVVFGDSGEGALQMNVSLNEGDAFETLRVRAGYHVSSMLGADLDALARAAGHEFPGLKAGHCYALNLVFDADGQMTEFVEEWLCGADTTITAIWSRIDGGFQLDSIYSNPPGGDGLIWNVPGGRVTVTGE